MTDDELTELARKEFLQLPLDQRRDPNLAHRYQMKYTYPDFLYRFRRGEPRDLEALERRSMWIPKFNRMGDPHDGRLEISTEQASRWMKRFSASYNGISLTRSQEEELKRIKAAAKRLQDWALELGVLCLSKDVTNPVLWDYYANWHAGFAIEFDWRFDRMTVDLKDPRTFATHVSYTDDYPEVDLLELTTLPPIFRDAKLLYTKYSAYLKEEEFRIIWAKEGDTEQPILYPITAIIFGLATPPDVIDRIQKMFAVDSNVELRKVKVIPRQFKLGIVPYNVT